MLRCPIVFSAVRFVQSNSGYVPFSGVQWQRSEATDSTQLTCCVQDLSDKKTCCGSMVLRYVHVFGRSKVSCSILAEVNRKPRWNRCRFVGHNPIADQYRIRKSNDLHYLLSISYLGQAFFVVEFGSCGCFRFKSSEKNIETKFNNIK